MLVETRVLRTPARMRFKDCQMPHVPLVIKVLVFVAMFVECSTLGD